MELPPWLHHTRFTGILAAVVLVGFILVASYSIGHDAHTSQVSIKNPLGAVSLKLLAGSQAASTTSSTTQPATSTTLKTATVAALSASTSATPSISATTMQAKELAGSGTQLLKSLVNIVCLSGDPSIPSISGTGVMIDSRGIILTAAHVAQLFLLQDYLGPNQVTCIVRTGSPARRAYIAEPIYISPEWLKSNPDTLKTTSPTGTGQNDFALLGVTGTATSTPVPTTFASIPLSTGDPQIGEQLAVGSYGAEYLTSTELNYSLYPILVFGSISSRYTFGNNTVDLISVQGSAASQEGSSGGGMVNAQGQLVGTITTSSTNGSISTRTLNAITVGHMRRSYEADTGENLDAFLASESVPQLIANFKGQAEQLGAQLSQNIDSH